MSSSQELSDAERERVGELVVMVNRLESKVEEQAERIDDLQATVQAKDAKIDALHSQLNNVRTALAGDATEFASWDTDQMDPIMRRLTGLEETVSDHDESIHMVRRSSGGASKPDERALHLRQVLFNKARSNGGKAQMDRDGAEDALGGGLHNATILDAMRRAADGSEADVDGSSDLQPVDGITFRVGRKRDQQSTVASDLTQMDAGDLRQNLMTKTGDGGSP